MTKTTSSKVKTTQEVGARFNELAQQGKWFEIQDELFADNVRSIDPKNSPYFGYAEGKGPVRKKGMDWVEKVEQVHGAVATQPLICGNHLAVGYSFEITTKDFGRIKIEEIMLYEVKDGQIVLEQFFY
jgi:hypothetical protein